MKLREGLLSIIAQKHEERQMFLPQPALTAKSAIMVTVYASARQYLLLHHHRPRRQQHIRWSMKWYQPRPVAFKHAHRK